MSNSLFVAFLMFALVMFFTPVKARIQEALDRLFYRERYSSRKALMRLSEDLNADLDLERTSERLLEGVAAALGLREIALFLPGKGGDFTPFRARGVRSVLGVGSTGAGVCGGVTAVFSGA